MTRPAIAVYGATGHTGRFVIDEIRRRGLPAVAIARNVSRLDPGVPARQASLEDATALSHALQGCAVLVNCAGPFLDTADPLVEAALRAGCHYLDVTAEQPSAAATLERHAAQARAAGRAVIPAAGFYGGLADLLASALVGTGHARAITVAVALDHWWPTAGTRETGHRNRAPRIVVEGGRQVPMQLPPRTTTWHFQAPLGEQAMVELGFSEIVTLAHHLRVDSLHSWLNTAPLAQLRDTSTPPPSAVDGHGRSAQRFEMEVVVEDEAGTRRVRARGQDIYAVSAPIVVEGAVRLCGPGPTPTGTLTLGQAFDPHDMLASLAGRLEISGP